MAKLAGTAEIAGNPAIAAHEDMPALSSIRQLQHDMETGAGSPLGLLGQAVLHDERVIERVLRVANHHAGHQAVGTITTLGRAIALLGLGQVRNICITARLMETLLRDRSHTTEEQERWLAELALALHMAMQARQLMQDCDAELRETVYLSALMQGLGENIHAAMPHCQIAISHASNFCHAAKDSWQSDATLEAISHIATFTGTSNSAAERRLRLCCHQTAELAVLYGAGQLIHFLPHSYSHLCPVSNQPVQAPPRAAADRPDLALQLHLLHELASVAIEKPDFDLVLHTALEGIQRGLQMDRSLVCLVEADGQQLVPRFALGRDSDMWISHFSMPLTNIENVFSHVMERGISYWVGSNQMPLTHHLCTPRMLHTTCASECFIAPLQFGSHVIGVLYADRYASRRAFTEEDYRSFRHFALQVCMCLQMAMQMG
ncbi:MAG TPA: HDOD domain-containing protein [Pseudomonadales bacterium]|nr:HDOD domain-containing protein [Pseudomonadales bacterium]